MISIRSSMGKRLIAPGVIFLVVLAVVLLGPRIWIALKFNQVGNILLCNDYSSIIYEMTESGLIVWSFDLPEYPKEERFWLPSPVRLLYRLGT